MRPEFHDVLDPSMMVMDQTMLKVSGVHGMTLEQVSMVLALILRPLKLHELRHACSSQILYFYL